MRKYVRDMTGVSILLSDEGELFETDSEGQTYLSLQNIIDWKKDYDARTNCV